MEEVMFFNDGDVRVTTTRLIIGPHTYAMSNITSVQTVEVPPPYGGPFFLFGLSIFFLIWALWNPVMWLFVLGSIGLCIYWGAVQKSTYVLVLTTASGEQQALRSEDSSYLLRVELAVVDAIVARG